MDCVTTIILLLVSATPTYYSLKYNISFLCTYENMMTEFAIFLTHLQLGIPQGFIKSTIFGSSFSNGSLSVRRGLHASYAEYNHDDYTTQNDTTYCCSLRFYGLRRMSVCRSLYSNVSTSPCLRTTMQIWSNQIALPVAWHIDKMPVKHALNMWWLGWPGVGGLRRVAGRSHLIGLFMKHMIVELGE